MCKAVRQPALKSLSHCSMDVAAGPMNDLQARCDFQPADKYHAYHESADAGLASFLHRAWLLVSR